MNIVDPKFLYEASFIENLILQVNLDINNKIMSIETDGAYLTDGFLLKAKIVIEDWYQLNVVKRGTNEKHLIDPKKPREFLDSIMEFHLNENELILSDVGVNCWVDWIFTKPKVTVYGKIDPNPPKF